MEMVSTQPGGQALSIREIELLLWFLYSLCAKAYTHYFSYSTDQIYFFDWLFTPNMIWVDLNEVPWDELDGRTLMLKPQDVELEGNSLCDFVTLDSEDPELEICATETDAAKSSSGSSVKGLAGWALLSAAMMMMQLNGM